MATGTSRHGKRLGRRAIAPAAAALVALLALVALWHASTTTTASSSSSPKAFQWLRASAQPHGWHDVATPSGATIAYPPGWHRIETDPGTASVAPAGPRGSFAGYLNATPQSGTETLANWSRFRVDHVADEGAHDVRLTTAATGLRFRSGRGSCVIDSYSTTRTRFREIACIVTGSRGTTSVVVAAAPVAGWAQQAPLLERAVASFTT
jgi:hypothetical protein